VDRALNSYRGRKKKPMENKKLPQRLVLFAFSVGWS